MKKVELDSSHDSLTTVCKDGSLRITNLNEDITFAKKIEEKFRTADVWDIQTGNWPKCLNKGLTKGQMSAIMPLVSTDEMFPKTNFRLHLALEAIRRGHKLVFTCLETDHENLIDLAKLGLSK